jgi:long-subunit acyl-CoA synthetase (AMP-forming)
LLKSILGRADDFFVTTAGEIISPSVIVNQIKLVSGIQQFRMIQEKKDYINAVLVPAPDYKEQNGSDFTEIIRKIMGSDVTVKTELKKEIPRQAGAKISALISKVNLDL